MWFSGCPSQISQPERFFLAYAQAGSSLVRVRFSEDGLNWDDGNFTSQVTGSSFRGVGAMMDARSLSHVVIVDALFEINFVWSIGPALWSNNYEPESVIHPQASAPCGVGIGDLKFLVAYRRGDDKITVRLYDYDQRSFVGGDYAPIHLLNTDVTGRPSITYMNGKILLTWGRMFVSPQGWDFQIITAVGEMVNNVPSFSIPKKVPLPYSIFENRQFAPGSRTTPDVTHDHNQFYIAFAREVYGGMWKYRQTVMYNSTDGESWDEHSLVPYLEEDPVGFDTIVNIAGKSDGTLIAAAIRCGIDPVFDSIVSAARYTNGVWSELNVGTMFGAFSAYSKQFALIGTGSP